MDLALHGTVDGIELTKQIRRSDRYRHIPIIAVTAHAFPEETTYSFSTSLDPMLESIQLRSNREMRLQNYFEAMLTHHRKEEVQRLDRSDEVQTKFNSLKQQWLDDVAFMSSLYHITTNINYLAIIALGEKVIPSILEDLTHEEHPWFTALEALALSSLIKSPVTREDAGNFKIMREKWLKWGMKNGILKGRIAAEIFE